MTRDEQIIAEAKKYYSDSINCHNAFLHGVEWADKHPKNKWHSIDDVPKGQYEIICKGKKVKCWHCDWKYIYENYPNWKEFVETMNVQKWLYMHEL